MSNFAFGTYRISDYNPQHIQALKEAIAGGIRMIDTSSNYMDGGAERAIALAFRGFEKYEVDAVEIVSKFGYIQNTNMQLHKAKPFEDVVAFSPNCYHSIAKSFLKHQLELSLQRLERKFIDCYLIHNPEYYIYDAISKGIDKDDILDTMYERIYEAFVGLEEEIKNGRILSYGISSNSFSKAKTEADFLPYEDLITLAQNAADFVGNVQHSFTTIELPINILEQEGLKCASWAKKNGLRVLANRPLNAHYNGKMYRLAEYDESYQYYHHLNELLEICDNDVLRTMYNILEELDASKHKFGWVGDFDQFLYAEILPHIKNTLEVLDEANQEVMLNFIDLFFVEYRKMVAYECSLKTKKELQKQFDGCASSLQECALRFLLQKENVDFILVGMRKPSYVHEVLSYLE
ncbi:MAG: aldo/keto reductase [Sulfurimonas sp.]|nr:aldo/keto reductase [Sulfurimonas sp.]MDD3059502.1 aldo/keto reductase [Sulfurimonas sp.]MDD5202439.1 aldo/keto reductase [Sulfurimonas sp.]